MDTPLYDYLLKYIDSNTVRAHMPGHKGRHPFDVLNEISKYDITEITGADSLFEADGIIKKSEENTALLYGAKSTSFSAGGSSLCIQTMLSLVASNGDKIIAGRNAHSSFVNACALLDATPVWVVPEYNDSFGVSGEITAQSIKEAIIKTPDAKAVYITSPDYLGCMSDIKAISDVCHQHGLTLIVDNAHGTHTKFTKEDRHPISLGADMCCDSAHKTLPVFTGGSYLHISKRCNITKEQVKEKMSLFGSTSPSYIILLSLDLNNLYLAEYAKKDFIKLEDTVESLYNKIKEKGFVPISKHYDFTKLTLDAYKVKTDGYTLGKYLQKNGIEYEYVSQRHVVLMLSPQNTKEDIALIEKTLLDFPAQNKIIEDNLKFTLPKSAMSIREATFSKKEEILVEKAFGRIAAQTKIKCPPGVPIVVAGEIIDENAQKILKKSSISLINVVK